MKTKPKFPKKKTSVFWLEIQEIPQIPKEKHPKLRFFSHTSDNQRLSWHRQTRLGESLSKLQPGSRNEGFQKDVPLEVRING